MAVVRPYQDGPFRVEAQKRKGGGAHHISKGLDPRILAAGERQADQQSNPQTPWWLRDAGYRERYRAARFTPQYMARQEQEHQRRNEQSAGYADHARRQAARRAAGVSGSGPARLAYGTALAQANRAGTRASLGSFDDWLMQNNPAYAQALSSQPTEYTPTPEHQSQQQSKRQQIGMGSPPPSAMQMPQFPMGQQGPQSSPAPMPQASPQSPFSNLSQMVYGTPAPQPSMPAGGTSGIWEGGTRGGQTAPPEWGPWNMPQQQPQGAPPGGGVGGAGIIGNDNYTPNNPPPAPSPGGFGSLPQGWQPGGIGYQAQPGGGAPQGDGVAGGGGILGANWESAPQNDYLRKRLQQNRQQYGAGGYRAPWMGG